MNSTLEVPMDPTYSGNGIPYLPEVVRRFTSSEIERLCSKLLSGDEDSPHELRAFLRVYEELARLNQALLSYLEDAGSELAEFATPEQARAISDQTRSIRNRLSMMSRLAADLKRESAGSTRQKNAPA